MPIYGKETRFCERNPNSIKLLISLLKSLLGDILSQKKSTDIDKIVRILKEEVIKYNKPAVSQIAEKKDPFKVLIGTVLSARTKDQVTGEASTRLFNLANTPEAMAELPLETIEQAIYPVGFWRQKAKNIVELCRKLVNEFESKVPDELNDLITLPGVGRKTANLVLTIGFGKLGICVDTHVHRISNRLGYVKTKTPKETEFALRKKLPKKYWIIFNGLLVTYGQNVCTPISPWCSKCPISVYCKREGVTKNR